MFPAWTSGWCAAFAVVRALDGGWGWALFFAALAILNLVIARILGRAR